MSQPPFGLFGDFFDNSIGKSFQSAGFLMQQLGRYLADPHDSDPWENAVENAIKEVRNESESKEHAQKITDALQVANARLDEVFHHQSNKYSFYSFTRSEWIKDCFPAWKKLITKMTDQANTILSSTWDTFLETEVDDENLRKKIKDSSHVILPLLNFVLIAQSAPNLTKISELSLGTTDACLTLLGYQKQGLIEQNIVELAIEHNIEIDDFIVEASTREAVRSKLFEQSKWINTHIPLMIGQYISELSANLKNIASMFGNFNVEIAIDDPERFEESVQEIEVETELSEAQKMINKQMRILLSLIEGWVDFVSDLVLRSCLPMHQKYAEILIRRRSGAESVYFPSFIGMSVKADMSTYAKTFFKTIYENDPKHCFTLWSHPDFLPSDDQLKDPASYIDFLKNDSATKFE